MSRLLLILWLISDVGYSMNCFLKIRGMWREAFSHDTKIYGHGDPYNNVVNMAMALNLKGVLPYRDAKVLIFTHVGGMSHDVVVERNGRIYHPRQLYDGNENGVPKEEFFKGEIDDDSYVFAVPMTIYREEYFGRSGDYFHAGVINTDAPVLSRFPRQRTIDYLRK